jgi:hypothetical protein
MNNTIDGRAIITAPRICRLSTSELCRREATYCSTQAHSSWRTCSNSAHGERPVNCPVVQRDCIKHWRGYNRLLIGVYRLPARVIFAKLANKG